MPKYEMNQHVRLANDYMPPADPGRDTAQPYLKPERFPRRGAQAVIVSLFDDADSPEQMYYVRVTPWLDPFLLAETELLTTAEFEQQEAEMQVKGSDPRDDMWPDEYRIDPASGRPYIPEAPEQD